MAFFALVALSAMLVASQPANAAFHSQIDAIKDGQRNCPHCVLAGADLSNQCVKGGNLQGADFDNAKLVLTCMSHANFKGATFRRADLSGANLADSNLNGADMTGAILSSTSFKGTDLRHTVGLTQAQLDKACGDATTKAPAGMTVPVCTY